MPTLTVNGTEVTVRDGATILDAARQIGADRQVSVVVLCSALSQAFCVGADLKERGRLDDDELRVQRRIFIEAFGAKVLPRLAGGGAP